MPRPGVAWIPSIAGLVGQVTLELENVLREVVGGVHPSSQCAHGVLVGPGRTAEAEVDPSGVQRLQGAELLGDGQRRVVRQHDAAGAEPDRLGVSGDVGNEDARRRGRDARHVVMLGVPDPPVAQVFGGLGQCDARGETLAGRLAAADRCKVKNREAEGHTWFNRTRREEFRAG